MLLCNSLHDNLQQEEPVLIVCSTRLQGHLFLLNAGCLCTVLRACPDDRRRQAWLLVAALCHIAGNMPPLPALAEPQASRELD